MRRTLFCSYMTVLLVFVSNGIAAGFLGWPVEAVFFLNFLAIILLAPIIAFSIDELALGVGHAFGRLMKAISCNAVEMIVRYLCCNVVI
jgi:Ca2+:H+ antiporter